MNILNRNIIRKNLTSVSVVLFLTLFILVQYIKPSFFYMIMMVHYVNLE